MGSTRPPASPPVPRTRVASQSGEGGTPGIVDQSNRAGVPGEGDARVWRGCPQPAWPCPGLTAPWTRVAGNTGEGGAAGVVDQSNRVGEPGEGDARIKKAPSPEKRAPHPRTGSHTHMASHYGQGDRAPGALAPRKGTGPTGKPVAGLTPASRSSGSARRPAACSQTTAPESRPTPA